MNKRIGWPKCDLSHCVGEKSAGTQNMTGFLYVENWCADKETSLFLLVTAELRHLSVLHTMFLFICFFMTYINQFLWLCSIVLKDFYMTLVAFPFIEYYTGMLFFENVSKLSFLFYSFSIFFNRRVCILIMAKFCVLISIME